MRSRIRLLCPAFVLALAAGTIYTQAEREPINWHAVKSNADGFSVAIPAGYIANKQRGGSRTTLAGGAGQMSFEIEFTTTSRAAEMMRDVLKGRNKRRTNVYYKVGKTKILISSVAGQKIYRVFIAVATQQGFYELDAAALGADNAALLNLLASLNVDGVALMKTLGGAAAPAVEKTVDVELLESSDIVKAVMARTQTDPIDVDLNPVTSDSEREAVFYSRPLIAVYKPAPSYTDEARRRNIQGSVTLRVLFKANGDIGRIRVISGLPRGLTERAVEAAKKVKFVPAERDGKLVDSERNLVYTFTIY